MKVFRLHLPLCFNDGRDASEAHKTAASALAGAFGGFTAWDAQGAWFDGARVQYEPVRVYEVAAYAGCAMDFLQVSRYLGHVLEQKAVFVIVNGDAQIVNLEENAK